MQIGSLSIDIPGHIGRKASAYVGKEIIFGLRPEDIYSHGNCPLDNLPPVDCDVLLVENMGNDLFVHVSRDDFSFVARLAIDNRITPDATHAMLFDTRNCHLFDKKSGENLTV